MRVQTPHDDQGFLLCGRMVDMSNRNWVGNISIHYDGEDALITFVFPSVIPCTRLTMDQAESLSAILRDYVKQYQEQEPGGSPASEGNERILALQKALDTALIGGNHLASNLIGILGAGIKYFPPKGTPHEEVQKKLRKRFPHTWIGIYEQWCAWNCCMEARDQAEKALEGYTGEVLGFLKP